VVIKIRDYINDVKFRIAGAGFYVINMGAFVWKGRAIGQKKNGLPNS
jgi:hypothetical protein